MDKLELKRKILETCLNRQRLIAENAANEMQEALQAAHEYGTPEDWFDSYKSDMLEKRDRYGRQLKKAQEEIVLLERIDTIKELDRVAFGAIVHTMDQKLFVSIGLGKVDIGKETFFAISPAVPIYLAIKGLQKGDTFDFRGKKNKILDLF